MPTGPGKRRCLLQYFTLVMLFYGSHASVRWTGLSCRVRARSFSAALSMTTWRLRRCLEKLEEVGYISGLEITHGYLSFTLQLPERWRKELAA